MLFIGIYLFWTVEMKRRDMFFSCIVHMRYFSILYVITALWLGNLNTPSLLDCICVSVKRL
jgi:hypothetical protein